MGCCGKRERFGDVHDEQKWDFVNLDDFKSSSCWTPLAYGYLWIMLFVSLSIYVVDTFVAVNLLAFNKWAGQIEPAIPFEISRWIFAGCIILSFVLLIERWIRAIRVIKQGGVAKSYLDPLAVRVQSIRMGDQGRGYKRFLVFAELTKSRKGADYVALFAYFSFEAWLRVLFAEGPRVVVNGITLYSVTKLNLVPTGDHAAKDGTSPVAQFFINIGAMADEDKLQATVLFGMLWTCLIWIFAAFSLASSVILYLLFLWHHIPSEAGGLKNYCRIKINKRMERLVREKVDKALKKENAIRVREDARAAKDGISIKKQPTLPDLGKSDGDSMMPPLSRTTTMTTLPEYSSRPPTAQGGQGNFEPMPPMPTLPGQSRPGPQRSFTHGSQTSISSFASNAPLMNSAGDMGYSPDRSPGPGPGPTPWGGRPGPNRAMTNTPQNPGRSFSPAPLRPGPGQGGLYPLEPLGPNSRRASDNDSVGGFSQDRSLGTRTPSWDRPGDMPGRRPQGNQANPYFPPIPESGRNSPAMGGPPRRFSPPGSGPMGGGPPPSQRSFTPVGPPLARVQTAEDAGGYRAFTPQARTMSPGPMQASPADMYGQDRYFNRPPPPSGRQTPQSGYPPQQRPPPRRQSSDDRDILDYY